MSKQSVVYAPDSQNSSSVAEPAPVAAKKANPKAKKAAGTVKKAAKTPTKAAGAVKKAAKGKAAPKAKKAAKAAPKVRQRDPATLDSFGFRKDSIKSKAAAMYAGKKGATLAEVREMLDSSQFNLLTELEAKGHTITKAKVDGLKGRKVTRYKIERVSA